MFLLSLTMKEVGDTRHGFGPWVTVVNLLYSVGENKVAMQTLFCMKEGVSGVSHAYNVHNYGSVCFTSHSTIFQSYMWRHNVHMNSMKY